MFGSGHSTFDSALVAESPYLELVFARRKEEASWGWIPFAAFIAFLFIDWLFGLCLPEGDPEGAWTCMFILLGWGFLALVHLIILPIWMLIASLRYWEVRQRAVAVAAFLFSLLAPRAWFACWRLGPFSEERGKRGG